MALTKITGHLTFLQLLGSTLFFWFCMQRGRRGGTWHQLITGGIHTTPHECLQSWVSMCTRAELAGIPNVFKGCAFYRTSYETAWSSFARQRSHTTALQHIWHKKYRWPRKPPRPSEGSRMHLLFSPFSSHSQMEWPRLHCSHLFSSEDAGNSCPVSLIARCGLSLTACLMSPVGWDSPVIFTVGLTFGTNLKSKSSIPVVN